MDNRNIFASTLRSLRHKAEKSMGDVARALDVSVVYYSDVENGRRPPFSPEKGHFEKLAQILGANANELRDLAARSRKSVEIALTGLKQNEVQVTLSLARRLKEGSLTSEDIEQLRALLNGGDNSGQASGKSTGS